jgi:hypothetical protein
MINNKVQLLIQKHHELLESFVVFYGWILKIFGYMSLMIVLVILLIAPFPFGITALGTSVAFIIVGTQAARESIWSGIGLLGLSVVLVPAMLFIPHGYSLFWFFLLHTAAGLAALAVYGTWPRTRWKHGIFSLLIAMVFMNFVSAHIYPSLYGMHTDIGVDRIKSMFLELSTDSPQDLLEGDAMREQIIELYDLPYVSTDDKILSTIKENPEPLNELQSALPFVSSHIIEETFFGYVASMYLSLIK